MGPEYTPPITDGNEKKGGEEQDLLSVESAGQYIRDHVAQLTPYQDDPFIVTDLGEIQKRVDLWKTAFPNITPYFALKAQNNAKIVELLAGEGFGFDVASLPEINKVKDHVPADMILYAQPYKQPSHLKTAIHLLSVCDSVDEIRKVGEISAELGVTARILLRILPANPTPTATSTLSSKFGAPFEDLEALATEAKNSSVMVTGISFHVGSHCQSAAPYTHTLPLARKWWNRLVEMGFTNMTTLDIGGGYPGEGGEVFLHIAKEIKSSLEKEFGDLEGLKVIAEPGRFIVTTSQTVVTKVISVKRDGSLVLNTGVYGGLANTIWDKKAARGSKPYVVGRDTTDTTLRSDVAFWGPTCDSSDKMLDGYTVAGAPPVRGDWVAFPDLGSYNSSLATSFNGFNPPAIHFVRSTD
eukprot:sb/3465181/